MALVPVSVLGKDFKNWLTDWLKPKNEELQVAGIHATFNNHDFKTRITDSMGLTLWIYLSNLFVKSIYQNCEVLQLI